MQVQVNTNKLVAKSRDYINENEYKIHEIEFDFAEEYTNNLVKVALFSNAENTYKVIITNNKCDIPPEILQKKSTFVLGVYGYETQNNELILRYSPSPITLFVSAGSYIPDEETENSEPITPSELEQYQQALQDGLEEVSDKLEDMNEALEEVDTALDNVNTAIQETENLDLDAEKVNKTTTVIITKKDGTEKSVSILDGEDGVDLQFIWQGTSLGIKTENQQEYTFVDLQGVQGPAGPQGEPFTIKKTYTSIAQMNADFNNMNLGDYVMIASTVEVEDNAKLYTRGESQWIFITDFSGATGIRGETGLTPNIQIGTVTQGSSFSVTRTGTNENPVLNFTMVKGDNGTNGQDGYTPVRGTDYWTASDISAIESHCDNYIDANITQVLGGSY